MIRTRLWLLLLTLAPVYGLSGQAAGSSEASDPREQALARVDSLYWAFDVAGSLAAAEALTGSDPDGAAAWRAARATVALGMADDDDDAANAWYDRGIAHAERAYAADSLSMDALFWLTATRGRRALVASARDAARLGDQVWRLAHRMLARDPDYAAAHNVLGKLQYEVMTLSRVERFIAKLILGDNEALQSSSWEGAERAHRRAVELMPDAVIYRYDLGRMLLRRGRLPEALAELRVASTLPPRYPSDPKFIADARRILRENGVDP